MVARSLVVCLALAMSWPMRASAQTTDLAEWIEMIASARTPWTGPRVPWPPIAERPDDASALVLASTTRPVVVHAERGVSEARARAALLALERAQVELEALGWGVPPSDGGLGGGDAFDLYLRRDPALPIDEPGAPGERVVSERRIAVGLDAPAAWGDMDGAIAHATLAMGDIEDDGDALFACVVAAYTEGLVLALDPAESPAWRRALGGFLAYRIAGRMGCGDGAIEQQRHPERSYVSHQPASDEGGALLLAAVSARHDEESGDFVRDLFHGARQWTWDHGELRSDPDLFRTLTQGTALARDPLARIVQDLAVSRFFAGAPDRRRSVVAYPFLRALPAEATVPIAARAEWSRLPRGYREQEGLEPWGSAYAWVDVRAAPPGARLRVWLRGESGVEWSLQAARIDAAGVEMGRMRAPVRITPEAYLPVELGGDAGMAQAAYVLVVVTNMSSRAQDADGSDENVRAFRVIFDRATD